MKQDRLRALILSVGLDLSQAMARRLVGVRPKRQDLQDHPAIRMAQQLCDRSANHLGPGANEGQKSRSAVETEVLQIITRKIADAAIDRALKEGNSLVPDGPCFLSVTYDEIL
jgi:hypothetical protein